MRRVWNFFASVYLTVILSALICMVAAWGSILSVRYPQFYRAFDQEVLLPFISSLGAEYLPLTAWVWALIALTAVFGINTFVCTADKAAAVIRNKKPWAALFPHIVHVGFLIALLGHLVGSVWGFKSYGNVVFKGDSIPVPHTSGLFLRLDSTEMNVLPSGELDSLETGVTLLDAKGEKIEQGTLGMNAPLIHDGIAFYHFDQGQSPSGLVMEIDGKRESVELEGSFQSPDGAAFRLGEIYPDFAVDAEGKAYNRSGDFSNPYVAITGAHGTSFLPLSAPGASVSADGHEIKLVDFIFTPYVIFIINKDPGIGFIIAGSTVLVVGMILLLFFRGERAELVRQKRTGE
ncbi:MAG: cytochrome c biogenesis protein ResB [Deltaproteobacteria bacterium]|nr:cytochrome c biogenesis protein ResB [Deltaproteobacteria bacterium]